MICVDTNVLIRVLVDDPGAPEQVQRARSVVGRAKRVFVSQPVQIESAWVLTRSYRFGKEALLEVLGEVQRNQAFELEHAEVFTEALAVFRNTSMDFADAVVLTIGRRRGLTVVSFDKKLARQDGARLVE